MENIPPFIQRYAERIGKEVSAFTLDDWRSLAFDAADEIEALNRELSIIEKKLPPPPGDPGRPRKNPRKTKNFLWAISNEGWIYQEVKHRGRHRQTYYGMPIEWYADALAEIGKWPNAPRYERQILKSLLDALRQKKGGYADIRAVERAIRRHRADTIQNKPA